MKIVLSLIVLVGLVGAGGGASAAPSRECLAARNQATSLRQRLDGERRLLQGCQAHLGTCTPGTIEGIQEAIRGLEEQIADAARTVELECRLSPPASNDVVRVSDVSPDAAFGEPGGAYDPGGQIDAIAVDPTNPRVVYAAGETSGVWKSTDGARTWSAAGVGLQWGSTIDDGLAVDPANPRRLLYATTRDDLGPGVASRGWGGHAGLYVSRDAAATWTHVAAPGCFPDYTGVLFGNGVALAATHGCGVLRSTSAAMDAWSGVSPGGRVNVDRLAVAGDVLFACSGDQVFRSPDLGVSWDAASITLPGNCAGLAVVPGDAQRLLVVVPVRYTNDAGESKTRYQPGIVSVPGGQFTALPEPPRNACCGHPFVTAYRRPSHPTGLGPGRSYSIWMSNAYQLFEYQAAAPESPARWNVVPGMHVDIHGLAVPTSTSPACQVYVATDGGVFTDPGGDAGCVISRSAFVRATHGLHAYGTFGLAGLAGPSSVVYAASDDNGIWAGTIARQAPPVWGDLGSNIGETGVTLVDPATASRFTSQRSNHLFVWHTTDGSRPGHGTPVDELAVCPEGDPADVHCSFDRVTQVVTTAGQTPPASSDLVGIRHDPNGGAYHVIRNVAGTAGDWSDVGEFPATALDVQTSGGHAEPYVYVLTSNGSLYQGHFARPASGGPARFGAWRNISAGVTRVASFAVDPYAPGVVYVLDLANPDLTTDDDIKVTADATSAAPHWSTDTALTRLATGAGRYRLACGDGAPGAPPAGSQNFGENHGYRYECALNQVVFVPGHDEVRFAVLSAGIAFTRDGGAHWKNLGSTSPLARPVAAFYDPTRLPTGESDLYVGLRGRGVVRMRSRYVR